MHAFRMRYLSGSRKASSRQKDSCLSVSGSRGLQGKASRQIPARPIAAVRPYAFSAPLRARAHSTHAMLGCEISPAAVRRPGTQGL